jgi:hypothetical protein
MHDAGGKKNGLAGAHSMGLTSECEFAHAFEHIDSLFGLVRMLVAPAVGCISQFRKVDVKPPGSIRRSNDGLIICARVLHRMNALGWKVFADIDNTAVVYRLRSMLLYPTLVGQFVIETNYFAIFRQFFVKFLVSPVLIVVGVCPSGCEALIRLFCSFPLLLD